jgi:hypothetical protein
MNWLRRLFSKPIPFTRELVHVTWAEGDRMLRADEGWGLAPEEDLNRQVGMVYLQRRRPLNGDSPRG